MPIPTTYLTTSSKLKTILDAVRQAGVPERFTYEFLKQLGHQSSSDRPVIPVMKALGFLNDTGQPTDRYRQFKDPAQSGAVMAEAIREAYSDVFTVDQKAHTKTATELKGVFARLSGKGDSVNEKMAMTFKALADLADFTAAPTTPSGDGEVTDTPTDEPPTTPLGERERTIALRHDIHVHLPITTNIAVYDAIFRSLRENLG